VRKLLSALALSAGFVLLLFSGEVEAGTQTTALSGEPTHETAARIIAAHIRNQGYFCWEALRAERDRERSLADKAVWVVSCQNATYRVRLVPNKAAIVERLETTNDNDHATTAVSVAQ
jgi:hypothetical protein